MEVMIMNSASRYVNATDLRKNFSEMIDTIIHKRPQFVKRTRNHFVMIEENEFNRLLSVPPINVEVLADDDGSYFAKNDVFEDVFSIGSTKEDAINAMCENLIEYAEEYYDEYDLYSKAPNRRNQAPYILKIHSAKSPEAVKEMLNA